MVFDEVFPLYYLKLINIIELRNWVEGYLYNGLILSNNYYKSDRELCEDIVPLIRREILYLKEQGCKYIQIDEPLFARYPENAIEFGVENLERAFHNCPENVTRTVHICCGYPDKIDKDDYPKAPRESYFKIAEAMENSSVMAISLEDAHRYNDLKLLEIFKNTTIIFGVVAIAKSRVESVDEIRNRLKDVLEHIDSNRLIAAPDCGLGILGKELAIRKLKNLSEAAHSIET